MAPGHDPAGSARNPVFCRDTRPPLARRRSTTGGVLRTEAFLPHGVTDMSLLPFGDLPRSTPRRFVPETLDLAQWDQIAPLFDRLEERSRNLASVSELEAWLVDCGELQAALEEEGAKRYIAMTCHTDSPEAEKAYLWFVEEIEPRLKPRRFALAKAYLAQPLRPKLPPDRYRVLDRDTALQVELYRDENVALETEEAKVGNEYNKLSGSLTVEFRGEQKTLTQMGRYQ
ncbi:MAG: hypothetical protein ACKPGI_12605 [Verrucomicrobiota bacterium]